MIRSALGKHVPPSTAEAVMAQIALAKTHQLPQGRKNIISYSLEINDFPSRKSVPNLSNPANYFRCTFHETYRLLLREDDLRSKNGEFYQFFTLEPNSLEELFQKDRCLYRDLLLLTAEDHKNFQKDLNKSGNSGQTQDTAKFAEFLMTETLVRCGGKERKIRPVKFFQNAKGIRISLPLAHFDFTGEPDKFQVEIVNTVRFPLCKEVSGYPLVFMSYSYSPRIDVTFSSEDIETVELFPFFSGVPPRQCRVEKPGKKAQLEFPGYWVLPSSGVYVAWRLKKPNADPASPGAAPAAPAVI